MTVEESEAVREHRAARQRLANAYARIAERQNPRPMAQSRERLAQEKAAAQEKAIAEQREREEKAREAQQARLARERTFSSFHQQLDQTIASERYQLRLAVEAYDLEKAEGHAARVRSLELVLKELGGYGKRFGAGDAMYFIGGAGRV